MSQKIELRTTLEVIRNGHTFHGTTWHDALAAHALLQAIAEARDGECPWLTAPLILDWVPERAAELLRGWMEKDNG